MKSVPSPSLFRRFWSRRPKAADLVDWEAQYLSGRWDYLASLEEMPRYALIVGYCSQFERGISVLDLGCGTGFLSQQLPPWRWSAYVGVDLSAVAVAQARMRAIENAEFLTADIEHYSPARKFDVIVLNEVLYYLRQPAVLLERCSSFLNDKGVFIVSLWDSSDGWRAWRQCSDRINVMDEVWVSNSKAAWWLRLCRPLGVFEECCGGKLGPQAIGDFGLPV